MEDDSSSYSAKAFKDAVLELVTLVSARFNVMPAVAGAKWPDRSAIDDPHREAIMYDDLRQQCETAGVQPESIMPFLEGLVEAAKRVQSRCFDLWQEFSFVPDDSDALSSPRNELDAINSSIIKVLSSPPFQSAYPELSETLFLELTSHLSLSVKGEELINEEVISLIMNGALKAFLR
ncbi:chorismate mutase [Endozoicomonas sp.]|nr:chorismate mutase [Endozoicomonas sp.]